VREGKEDRRPPVLLAPSDTARFQSARPRFLWQGVDSAYVLQIARDAAFTLPVVTDSLQVDTVFVPARSLLNDSTYYWRVGVRARADSCIFSVTRSFTVVTAPGLSPASLFLGFVPRGDTLWGTAVIRNPLPFPISVDSIRSQTGHFRVVTPLPAVVDSVDSLVLIIIFAPREFLVMVDSLRVYTMLGEHALRVTGNSPPPLCMAATDSIDFRSVAIGDTASATLVVHNRGVINSLLVSRLSLRSRAFRFRTRVPLTVPARDSALIPVWFNPGVQRSSSFGSF
jgi:hypothetical protein